MSGDAQTPSKTPTPVDKDVSVEAHKIESLAQKSLVGDTDGIAAANALAKEVHTIMSSPDLSYRTALNAQLQTDNSGIQFRPGDGSYTGAGYLQVDKLDANGKRTGDWQTYYADGAFFSTYSDKMFGKGNQIGDTMSIPTLPEFLQPKGQSPATAAEAKELEALAQKSLAGDPTAAQQLTERLKAHGTDPDTAKIFALNDQFAVDHAANGSIAEMNIIPRSPNPGEKGNTFDLQVTDPKDPRQSRMFSSGIDPSDERKAEEKSQDYIASHFYEERNSSYTDEEQRQKTAEAYGLDLPWSKDPSWQDLEKMIPEKMRQTLSEQYPSEKDKISQLSDDGLASRYNYMESELDSREQAAQLLGLKPDLGVLGSPTNEDARKEAATSLGLPVRSPYPAYAKGEDWSAIQNEAAVQIQRRGEAFGLIGTDQMKALGIDETTASSLPPTSAQDTANRDSIAEKLGLPPGSNWEQVYSQIFENLNHNMQYTGFASHIAHPLSSHESLWPYTSF